MSIPLLTATAYITWLMAIIETADENAADYDREQTCAGEG
jgi:hypothetical protein